MAEASRAETSACKTHTEPSKWPGTGPDEQQDNGEAMSDADDGSSDAPDESLAMETGSQRSAEFCINADEPLHDDDSDARSDTSYSDAVELSNECYSNHENKHEKPVEPPSDSVEQQLGKSAPSDGEPSQDVTTHRLANGTATDAPSAAPLVIERHWPSEDTLPRGDRDDDLELTVDDQEKCDEQIYSESSSCSADESEARNIDIDMDGDVEVTQQHVDLPQYHNQALPTQVDRGAVVEPRQQASSKQVRFSQPTPQEMYRDYSRTQHPSVTPRKASTDDTNDLLRVIEYKLRQKEQSSISAFAQERAYLEAKFSASHETSTDLERELHKLREDMHTLTQEKQRADADYAAERNGSADVIEGLRDALQSRIDELDTITQQLVDAEEMIADTEKKAENLRGELQVLKTSHTDTIAKLQTVKDELSEHQTTMGILERKLADVESAERKSLADSVASLRATVETRLSAVTDTESNITRELQTMQQTLRSLDGKSIASPSDCAAVNDNVGAMVKKVEDGVHALANIFNSDSDDEAIARINDIVIGAAQTLHQDLVSWQDTVEQQSVSGKQEHAELVERLQASLDRAVELETQLEKAKSAQDVLTEAFSARNATIHRGAIQATVQGMVSPGPTREEVEEQLAQAHKEGYDDGVRFMSDSATSFRIQEKATFANATKEVAAERDTAVQGLREKSEQVELLLSDIERLQSESAARTTLKAQLEQVKSELQGKRAELEMAHGAANEKTAIEARNKSLTGEIEDLRGKLTELEESHRQRTHEIDASRQATEDAVSEAHNNQSKYTKLQEFNIQLSRDLEVSRQAVEDAESAGNDARSRVETLVASEEEIRARLECAVSGEPAAKSFIERMQSEHSAANETWQRQLSETQDKLAQSDAGHVEAKESFDKLLHAEEDQHREQMEALLSRLADVENNVAAKVQELETVKQSIHEWWMREEDTWREALNKAHRDLKDVVAAKDAAVSALEAVKQAADARVSYLSNAGTNTDPDWLRMAPPVSISALPPTIRDNSAGDTPQQSFDHAQTVSSNTNETPNMGTGPVTMPPRQRRKVDRSTHFTGPILAPEVIRPKSREAPQPAKVPGPVVEESQFGRHAASYPQDSQVHLELRASYTANSDEMLDSVSAQALPETVPETQFDEAVLTFADFKNTFSSSDVPQQPVIASQSRYFTWTGKPLVTESERPGLLQATSEETDRQDFHIYEDPRQATELASQGANAPKIDYTYRKSVAKPNSASKRTASYGSAHDYPRTVLEPLLTISRFKTLEHTRAQKAKKGGNRIASQDRSTGHSSSPPFVLGHGGRSQNQYHTVANSAKATRRTAATYVPTDPRLAGRPTGSKRSAPQDAQIERPSTAKRRQTTSNVATRSQGISSGVEMLSGSSQSVNDLPHIVDPSRRAPGTGGPGTRMQRSGGGASRSNASAKKSSKSQLLCIRRCLQQSADHHVQTTSTAADTHKSSADVS
ncbi:hypothetical protein LTR95_001908 [Oleoguttula sp. CCFEE 5521]